MEIRIENEDLSSGALDQLRKDAMAKVAEEKNGQHYFSIFYHGICIAYGVMPKELLLGTLYLGEGITLNFHTEPIELPQKDCHGKRSKRNRQ